MADSKIDKRLKNARIAYERGRMAGVNPRKLAELKKTLDAAQAVKDANRAAHTGVTHE